MASSNACWGIEVGAGAIKGVRLERDPSVGARVTDFAIAPHPKPLSTPDIDQRDAMRVALGAFFGQNDVSNARVAVSVPGHMAFARFAKLPPVEPKRIPNTVKFEAMQQIPFPIEEVEWDYQTFTSPDSPDVEVGIFAMTRERVMERLAALQEVGVTPDCVTLSPVALYNAVAYDFGFTDRTPGTIILDIGTVSTDLLVADAGRVWIRTFPIGGHNFTEALVSAFKTTYSKAEKLKRDMEQSPHKRHMFQAMKGVFEDLAQDIQRSISYYQQLHPEAKLDRLVGVGATFQLPGLRKFLSQRLQMDVVRLEGFQRIGLEGPQGAALAQSSLMLATAYGLALQGVGLAPINANLIPVSVVRDSMWRRKTPWFAAAAALSVVAGATALVKPMLERPRIAAPEADAKRAVDAALSEGNRLKNEWSEVNNSVRVGYAIENLERLLEERDLIPRLVDDVSLMLAAAEPQPALMDGGAATAPPSEWRAFALRSLSMDPAGAAPAASTGGGGRRGRGGGDDMMGGGDTGGGGAAPRMTINMTAVVDSPNADPGFAASTLVKWLQDNANRPGLPYRIVPPDARSVARETPTATAGAQPATDPLAEFAPLPEAEPLFPPSATVYRYRIAWKVEVLPPGELTKAADAPAGEAGAEGAPPPEEPPAGRPGRGGRQD